MKLEDFELVKTDTHGGHQDFWFKVSGESKEKLCRKYFEYGMIEVNQCVYSKDEDMLGIKRQYPFNYDVIIVENKELKNILIKLIKLNEEIKKWI